MSLESIFGQNGIIAQKLPHYEPRSQQLHMADAVAEAIADRRHLMVEAGTGVGKSFAYLVPAILAATANKDCRVVISTHTISLQEQLVHKDIPFLQSVMPQQFNATLVKGRSNYLSLRRLRGAQQRIGALLVESAAVEQLQQIGRWSRTTRDGSRSDLSFQAQPAVWDLVESDSGNCLGRACPDYAKCYYFQGPSECSAPNCSSSITPSFSATWPCDAQGASLLPDYKVVVFDEAHTLEDVAADHLGLQLSRGALEYLTQQAVQSARAVACLRSFRRRMRRRRQRLSVMPASVSSPPSASGLQAFEPRPWRGAEGLSPRLWAARILFASANPPSCRTFFPRNWKNSERVSMLWPRTLMRNSRSSSSPWPIAPADWLLASNNGWLRRWKARSTGSKSSADEHERFELASAPIDVGPPCASSSTTDPYSNYD